MATNQIRKSGADPAANADGKNSGVTIDPGPYEAVVMKHVEATRSGQILVYIPDFGGVNTNEEDYIMVSYASPFYGKTFGTDTQSTNVSAGDSQWTSGMSYGMWMVPPDLGNKVLVTFAAGDRNRGYWFACIYDSPSHHMVPGLARNVGGESDTKPEPDTAGQHRPVVEANTGIPGALKDLDKTPRYAHEFQTNNLIIEGLDRDPVRGAISSSSLRESPSNVYGISTPGRPVTVKNQAAIARYGGHQFVMDDGDKSGKDQLIRLRTAGGHQLLMNDSENILYIASKSGLQWLEFSNTGAINVYATGGFNLRTQGILNLQGDAGVNISTNGVLKLNADIGVKVTTAQAFDLIASQKISLATDGAFRLDGGGTGTIASTGLMKIGSSGAAVELDGSSISANGSSPPEVVKKSFTTNTLTDVINNGTIWERGGEIDTACTVAPAHEPWKR
jgi:hypothetical protein